MITFNQTVGYDKDAIMVIEIDMGGSYLRFSDTFDKITLDGVDFDGKVILYDSVSEMTKDINVENGGGIGQVGNFSFGIARYNTYTGTSNFFNDFYPATSKPLLTSKPIRVGVCWAGATTLSQITWSDYYYIEDVSWKYDNIYLTCIDNQELDDKVIPQYVINEDNDNDISYSENAPENLYGTPIPVLYGDFTQTNLLYGFSKLAPSVCLDTDNIYKVSSHLLNELDGTIYKYIEKADGVMKLSSTGITYSNTRAGGLIDLDETSGAIVQGQIYFYPKTIQSKADVIDVKNVIDSNPDSYATLTGTTSGFILKTDVNQDDVGVNDLGAGDAVLYVSAKGETANGKLIVAVNPPAGYSPITTTHTLTTSKATYSMNFGTIPISELINSSFQFENDSTDDSDVYVYAVYIYLPAQEIVNKNAISYNKKIVTRKNWVNSLFGKTTFRQADEKIWIDVNALQNKNEIFINAKGYQLESWINL